MATAYVTLSQAGGRGQFGNLPVMAFPAQSETITTSSVSATGTKIANKLDYAQIWCATTVVAVAGPTPPATLAAGIVCPAGVATWFPVQAGDKIALIDG